MPIFTSIGAGILGALGAGSAFAVGAAPFAAAIGATAVGAAGYGAYAAGSALTSGNKTDTPTVAPLPSAPSLSPAPTPVAAENSAQAAVEKQRRMKALAGGRTLLTSESPTLSGTTGAKTLLGS